GPGEVRAENCAFGPHDALFHLREGRDKTGKLPSKLTFEHCSAFVVPGPAFRLDGNPPCTVKAGSCIFACPDPGAIDNKLILQTTAPGPLVKYQGTARNVYFGLNGLWQMGKTIAATRPDEFLAMPGCDDSE